MSAGIAIVVPIQRALDIIDSPVFADVRAAFMAKREKAAGYTSAAKPTVTAADEVPPAKDDEHP